MGSFLSVAIWESQFSLLGNSVNVAGKNRLLTSQFLEEVKDKAYVKMPDADPEEKLEKLEQNILFLQYGGEQDNLKLKPLDEQFQNDWELVYSNFQNLKSNYESFKSISDEQTLSPFDIITLEIDSLILISTSDNLVHKMGLMIDDISETLLVTQIILVVVNVTVHVGLIFLISKIFRNEFKKTMKIEKLATVGELSSRLAHDMRNPLSYINMSAQLLKSKTTEKDSVEKLEVIEKGIARMSHQINDIMDFVRSKEPELKLWNLKSILKECFDRLNLPDSVTSNFSIESFSVVFDFSNCALILM